MVHLLAELRQKGLAEAQEAAAMRMGLFKYLFLFMGAEVQIA
jgi:hypothetical protein